MGVVARQSGRSEPKAGPAWSASLQDQLLPVSKFVTVQLFWGFVNSNHVIMMIMSPAQKSFSRIHYLSKFFGRANFFCLSIVNTNISSRSCLPPRRASPGNKIFQSFLGRQNFVCLRIIANQESAWIVPPSQMNVFCSSETVKL